ncbi:MAG: 50S ribosomal protein L31 [Thermodesulfobacterium sp.]|nr:50S ribosomal protein L31 [Thermodesulfobacterium sp.]
MKKNIHPEYYKDAVVMCACGNRFTVGSTKKEIKVEICSKCHPFFTGEMKFVDTEGRIEKFMKKYADYYKQQQQNQTQEKK